MICFATAVTRVSLTSGIGNICQPSQSTRSKSGPGNFVTHDGESPLATRRRPFLLDVEVQEIYVPYLAIIKGPRYPYINRGIS